MYEIMNLLWVLIPLTVYLCLKTKPKQFTGVAITRESPYKKRPITSTMRL